MDKKIYKKPELEAYDMKVVGMLCASDPDKPQILDGEGSTDDLG